MNKGFEDCHRLGLDMHDLVAALDMIVLRAEQPFADAIVVVHRAIPENQGYREFSPFCRSASSAAQTPLAGCLPTRWPLYFPYLFLCFAWDSSGQSVLQGNCVPERIG
jgi:hypothetical protein